MRHTLSRLTLVASLALTAAAGCGKDDCPSPSFAGPATVLGPTTTAAGQTLVVRWPASPKDTLPLDYYRALNLGGNGSPTPVRRATLTADHEITLELEGLDAFARSGKPLAVVLLLPDPRDSVQCNHPGRGDSYSVTLTLSFDAAGKVTTAVFAPVARHYGGM